MTQGGLAIVGKMDRVEAENSVFYTGVDGVVSLGSYSWIPAMRRCRVTTSSSVTLYVRSEGTYQRRMLGLAEHELSQLPSER